MRSPLLRSSTTPRGTKFKLESPSCACCFSRLATSVETWMQPCTCQTGRHRCDTLVCNLGSPALDTDMAEVTPQITQDTHSTGAQRGEGALTGIDVDSSREAVFCMQRAKQPGPGVHRHR